MEYCNVVLDQQRRLQAAAQMVERGRGLRMAKRPAAGHAPPAARCRCGRQAAASLRGPAGEASALGSVCAGEVGGGSDKGYSVNFPANASFVSRVLRRARRRADRRKTRPA